MGTKVTFDPGKERLLWRMRDTGRRHGDGPLATRLSRSRRVLRTGSTGREDQFRPPSISGGCRLGKETFAGMGCKEEDAPKPAVPGTVGRPKRLRWFAALVAAVARYTR
jgi:hypothetical protein